MKIVITWTPPGATLATSFTLADTPDPIPMRTFRVNNSDNIQEAQFFRAAAASYYDRGNQRTEITFETSRLFADQVSAESFILTHRNSFPNQGLVSFVAGASGGQQATRYLKNGTVQTVSSQLQGCTTHHSYRITGGIMQTTPN